MHKTREYRASLILAAAITGSALSGCAGTAAVYDADNHQHHWSGSEDTAYRRYMTERHMEYHEYSKLSAPEQHAYWEWRESHPD